MAVMRGACDDVVRSSCEDPQFPSWMWRFNRNQHMTSYDPWQIREEQKPPHYRNMGMNWNFRFHPMGPNDGKPPLVQLGVNVSHELIKDRQAGFGNAALGRTPGPAPPRLFGYGPGVGGSQPLDDLYKVNEIHLISPGMSLFDYQPLPARSHDDNLVPLNPSHYLAKTLSQTADIPGTFPYFNKALPQMSLLAPRVCAKEKTDSHRDPMSDWQEKFNQRQAIYMMENCHREMEPRSSQSDENIHETNKILFKQKCGYL